MKAQSALTAVILGFTMYVSSVLAHAQSASTDTNKVPTLLLADGWKRLADTTKNLNVRDMSIILRGAGADDNYDISYKDILIYGKVKYLMPIDEALKSLPIKGKVKTKVLCANPAFPTHSFYLHSYDVDPIQLNWKSCSTNSFMSSNSYDQYIKAFRVSPDKTSKMADYLRTNCKSIPEEQGFVNLHVITDGRQQIVGLGFSCPSPKLSCFEGSTFWHAFDFMNMREKAITTAGIRHDYSQKDQVIHIYSQFGRAVYDWVSPKTSLTLGKDDDLLCWSQYLCAFFIPKPVADIILDKLK